MFISKINFGQYNYSKPEIRTSYVTNFLGRKPNINTVVKKIETTGLPDAGKNIVKKALLSIPAFIATYNLSPSKVKKAANAGELDLEGKKVNTEGAKTKDFVEKEEIYKRTHLSKKYFGEMLNITIHSVDWHIEKGNIEANEDGTINPEIEKNRLFVENFQKLKRKETLEYTPENYAKLQRRLGSIKLDYCLKSGLLVANEEGVISTQDPKNKEFLKKVDEKEITISSFYTSIRNLARRLNKSEIFVRKAIKEGRLVTVDKKGIDLNDPINIKFLEENSVPAQRKRIVPENYISAKDLAEKMGINIATISYHAKLGHLEANRSGIDMSNEKNIYFVNNYKKGEQYINPFVNEEKDIEKDAVYVTQVKFAERLGISQPTLRYHIEEGHVVYEPNGINVNNEQNKYFLENYERGKEFLMPGEEPKTLKKDVVKKKDAIKWLNFNEISIAELSKMIHICASAIRFHLGKGRLERTDNKKIDLANNVNRQQIEQYDEHVKRVYASMSDEQLKNEVNNLKSLLKNRISENVYTVASEIEENSADWKGYLSYSLSNIVDLSSLSDEQKTKLLSIFEEIIIDELESENPVEAKYYKSKNKLDILTYTNLLNELIQREKGVSTRLTDFDTDSISISPEIINIIEEVAKEYKEEIETYNKIMSKKLDVLIDSYMYHKYVIASATYEKLTKFNRKMAFEGLSGVNDDVWVGFYVEKVLKNAQPFKRGEANDYQNWKKLNMPKNADEVILDMLEQYRKLILNKICKPEILVKLQAENLGKQILPQHLENIVAEKLDLE